MKRWGLAPVAIVLLGAQLLAGASIAEERNAPASVDLVMLPGAITGVGSYGPAGYWRLCSPLSVGLNEWHVSFIEHLLKPSDAQRELLKKLLAASLDAKESNSFVLPRGNDSNRFDSLGIHGKAGGRTAQCT
jgi:hypothetical protein